MIRKWKLLILLLVGVMLGGCGPSYPVYPGALERENKDTPFFRCTNASNIVVGEPGQEIDFEVYYTPDPLEKVMQWYGQRSDVDGGGGFRGNELGEGQCPGAMYYAPVKCWPKCKEQIILVDKICTGSITGQTGKITLEFTDCEELGGTFITAFHR